MGADHDLGRRDALIGDLGLLGCGRQVAQRERTYRKAQRL